MAEREDERGALWEKTSARGKYMTGVIKLNGVEEKVVVFHNDKKKNEKEPDWRILKSQPKAETPTPSPSNTEIDPDGIPF